MIMTNRILPVALVAALIGGSVGAFVMHSNNSNNSKVPEAQTASFDTSRNVALDAQHQADQAANNELIPAVSESSSKQGAYKTGFADGFGAARGAVARNRVAPVVAQTRTRTVARSTARNARSSSQSRQVYYDYQQQPKGRSFWQKHRDKLTVAMGTGGGAVIGGLIGGKKGAAIGAIGGAGGSALYTYKLRKRNSNRY